MVNNGLVVFLLITLLLLVFKE